MHDCVLGDPYIILYGSRTIPKPRYMFAIMHLSLIHDTLSIILS